MRPLIDSESTHCNATSSFLLLVDVTGFEPVASSLRTRRSSKLIYTPLAPNRSPLRYRHSPYGQIPFPVTLGPVG